MRIRRVSRAISLLFTSHCARNRGPEAKETTMRHVAVFLSVRFVRAARDIAVSYLIRHEGNVSSPGKRLFPFVGETNGIFPRAAIVPLYCAVRPRVFIRSVNGIPRFTSRTIVRVDRFCQIPRKWKLTHVCCELSSALDTSLGRWQATRIFMMQPYIERSTELALARKWTFTGLQWEPLADESGFDSCHLSYTVVPLRLKKNRNL